MKGWTVTFSNRPQPSLEPPAPEGPRETPRRRLQRLGAKVAGALLLAMSLASPAAAEALLTPFAGFAFGGDTDDAKVAFGGILGFHDEDGVLGFAIDFGYAPDFLGTTGFGDNNVTTLMGNLVFMAPGPARLYASGGGGLFRTRVRDVTGFFEADSDDFGFDVGGGVIMFPGDGRVGIQGDIRYFRVLTDPEPDAEFDVDFGSLDFWRGTVGLALRF